MLTPTSLPQTEFASEVFDSLKACVDTCPTTQGIKLRVAENGTILLPVAYDHESERFIVDEAWLNREQCIVELGLPPNVSQAMLALHVVKKLFKEAINQQANASSTENDLNTVNLDREVTRVEHKLHEYTAIKESLRFIPPIGIQLFISVSWRCADSFARKAVVQVHRESTCAHLKRHRLARDLYGDLACLQYGNGMEAQSGCKMVTIDGSAGHYTFIGPSSLERYFALLFEEGEPDAFVVSSKLLG